MRKTQNWSTCILVVDDDEDIRIAVTDQLLAMGFEVYQAANGRDALAMYSRRRIDGILLDVQMPVMDGWTMLEQLHRQGSRTPTIVMSAGDPGETAPKAREYGAQGYLPKPFNFSHLQTTCIRVFGELPAAHSMPHQTAPFRSLFSGDLAPNKALKIVS